VKKVKTNIFESAKTFSQSSFKIARANYACSKCGYVITEVEAKDFKFKCPVCGASTNLI